ncbi:phosphatidate cytidylyltransferase [Coralloluteibacterium stylophorae]|uniref:phosphatidate cytidylyltransferase n=1 Tax=Coralloluteibacterium stylophorae TaxID=1776034 RepID=UPI001FEB5E28|nr:phosphatidate cytidylyltransferase [Coralloluteibacterium stylophorae]
MRTRVITALLLTPLAIAAVLLLPTAWFVALVAAVFLWGLWEYTRLVGIGETVPRAVLVLAHAAVLAALAWTWGGQNGLFMLITLLGALWWVLALLWILRPGFGAEDRGGMRMLKLAAGSLCVIPAWTALAVLHAESPRWALAAVAGIWAADSAAYFAGRFLGRRKLAPRVSPGKTWAGFWGGVVGCVVITPAFALLLGLETSLPGLAATAAVAAVASVVGDLFESLMKRHSGIKDSGSVLPGHGGILDRIDGVLAAMPVFVVLKGLFGL